MGQHRYLNKDQQFYKTTKSHPKRTKDIFLVLTERPIY